MPALNKPGVDWPEIRRRFEAGESAYSISQTVTVSKQAILKRANKEGWKDDPKRQPWAAAAATVLATMPGKTEHGALLTAAHGKRTPENAREIATLIAGGLTKRMAAHRCGMSVDTLDRWLKEDSGFAAEIEAAQAAYAATHIANLNAASNRGDVKAATWMLERHPSTRADFAGDKQGSGGPQILVQVNVTRGGRETLDTVNAKVIDADAVEAAE